MPGRILTLQRQARELGRLRTGYTEPSSGKGRGRPVRSETWIVTSHAQHYVEAAAAEWGGQVEQWQPLGSGAQQWRVITEAVALDAIMPPGDPLSQSYESWSRGGCARRCDGMTEQLSNAPCLCRGEYGEEWWTQPKDKVCQATTRLNLILPQMPDVGVWRMETHSHWAANEIAAHVDLVRSATGGDSAVPVRVRIEQRQRVANGQTKKYPVPVVELRGVTAGQMLSGAVRGAQLDTGAPAAIAGPATAALPAGAPATARVSEYTVDAENVRAAIAAVDNLEDLRGMWDDIKAAGLTDEASARAKELQSGKAADEPVDAEPVAEPSSSDDADAAWAEIMRKVPEEWSTTDVEKDFELFAEVPADQGTAEQMRAYLAALPERVKASS